jgi:hypothetical protein
MVGELVDDPATMVSLCWLLETNGGAGMDEAREQRRALVGQ